MSAVLEWVKKTSADERCFRAVQRWIKTNCDINENASCKFEKVLGSRRTCSFGVYQLWKNHSGENSVKNSNWRTRLFRMLLGRTWIQRGASHVWWNHSFRSVILRVSEVCQRGGGRSCYGRLVQSRCRNEIRSNMWGWNLHKALWVHVLVCGLSLCGN